MKLLTLLCIFILTLTYIKIVSGTQWICCSDAHPVWSDERVYYMAPTDTGDSKEAISACKQRGIGFGTDTKVECKCGKTYKKECPGGFTIKGTCYCSSAAECGLRWDPCPRSSYKTQSEKIPFEAGTASYTTETYTKSPLVITGRSFNAIISEEYSPIAVLFLLITGVFLLIYIFKE